MDIKGQGFEATVVAAEQTDQWLLDATTEIREAAEARGLEIPAFAGTTATEATTDVEPVVEAVPETKESLTAQLPAAITGYSAVMEGLNAGKRKNRRAEVQEADVIKAAFDSWLTDDRLALVNEIKEAQPDVEFTLVATPNLVVTPKDITAAAEKFGEKQPYSTYVWSELYGRYSAEELSGTTTENEAVVNFALIPSSSAPELEGTVSQQHDALAKLQSEHPELKVPSVLDAVTYWATLRAQGESLTGSNTFDKTYIRHFDLPEQCFGAWSYVPGSFVSDDGEPALYYSDVDGVRSGRVAVG